ncbi:MAG: 30S ribosomal protein S7 [Candidatus Beckwithbacteria bacterium GW2011_GWA2_43_10]|uniref:Small ribosomal subunit protein uS7 n=1 Tax=Candidatus Beckwithbacteria bacterium GW2011_GWA2_43_10 TaxID=1618369 RepID=A0A0G1F082_9BACT|nr:MAG: 30S ribosomal protein S7 [Candidatus Beckwithbacteria bacterium GW2011_GWA2_43_10]
MSRSGKIKKITIASDRIYNSRLVAKIINVVMKDGKKSIAQKQVYQALDILKAKTKADPLDSLCQALDNVKPSMEVRSRRIGGAAYQVPSPVRGDRKESLSIRWIINAARARSNREFHRFSEKLAAELFDALNNQGGAIEKKNQMTKMAEANKAFSHFRW